MLTDIRTWDNVNTLETDLCIVGAGAAGIAMALQWLDSSRNVLLLEGGGFELEAAMQDLYRGRTVGQPYYPLEAARLHYFGGTTGHWAGFCAPFDPIDFEHRHWVPHSGWPFRKEHLIPFYARAQEILELGSQPYDVDYWEHRDPEFVRLGLDERVAWTKMWKFSPPTRFGTRYRECIRQSASVHLLTHANVCNIEVNDPRTEVQQLHVRTMQGEEYRVRATSYVLACGTLENARLLLASNTQVAAGLGNEHDLVGRFFMEHVEMPAAELVLSEPRTPMKLYEWQPRITKARGELGLSSQVQRRRAILNSTASLRAGELGDNVASTFQAHSPEELELYRASTKDGVLPSSEPRERTSSPHRVFQLASRLEQSPNPQSRVRLARTRDALGMPRVELDWQLTALEKRSLRTFYEVLGTEVGRCGLGRIRVREWLLEDDKTWPSSLSGAWHHMGTTRMHHDPRQGVVDANCRVHSLANLYVAGASVFPTAGAANPTLTLVALTLRLSDHLKRIVGAI